MKPMIIRNEKPEDYRAVEELTRDAFWNHQVPGCNEHYIVNQMRSHEDFLPKLAFVLEVDGKIVANVMYVKTKLIDEQGSEKDILSFGPISVHPDYQRNGYGRKILEHSFKKAEEQGFDTVVILGSPHNYICYGFKNAIRYNVSFPDGSIPTALLVKELVPNVLAGKKWTFHESMAHHIDESKFHEYDSGFKPLKKEYRPSQELFYTLVRSFVKTDTTEE